MMENGFIKNIKFVIYAEHVLDIDDFADVTWRVANNIDPARDCFYVDDENGEKFYGLAIDGTRKYKVLDGFERNWPNTVTQSPETIKKVDEKWDQLGLGAFVPSPSQKYIKQLYPGKATAEEDV